MNTKNSKTNEPHIFMLSLGDKVNLKDPSKNMALANLSIYYTWKNIKPAYSNSKLKASAPSWNDEFDLPDGSYSIEDIQDYIEFIIKKHETLAKNTPIQIYQNKIKKKNCFQSKNRMQIRIIISRNDETIREYKKRC